MARKIRSCCVALIFILAAIAAVPRSIRSIEDVPNSALMLLYWFAKNICFNYNEIALNFDPSTDGYGSHHYGNYEHLLGRLPPGYEYFTIGNTNEGSFPQYVRNKGNRARIIFRVRKDNKKRLDRIFITRHLGNYDNSNYVPEETYEICVNVLRELARRPLDEIQQRAAGYPYGLQSNANRYFPQAQSFSNQSYYTSAPRPSSEDSFLCQCLGVLCIILVVFFLIIVGNAKT